MLLDMRFDLLVPSGGNLDRICQLFGSVVQQTILPERIVVVLDKPRDQDEIEHFLYSLHKTLGKVASRLVLVHHRNSDFEAEQGVGYVRKYLLSQATSSYVYMIDDDNVFDETFFERTSQIYQDIVGKIGTECVLSPTILLRKTGQVQSQGILGFASYLFPKYRFQQLTDQPW
jgi:glycosyltransferase involved in cell wall biosynthesis